MILVIRRVQKACKTGESALMEMLKTFTGW